MSMIRDFLTHCKALLRKPPKCVHCGDPLRSWEIGVYGGMCETCAPAVWRRPGPFGRTDRAESEEAGS